MMPNVNNDGLSRAVLSMVDSGTRQKAKILPYKHTIAAYGAATAGFPLQIAYGGWQKNAMPFCHSATI